MDDFMQLIYKWTKLIPQLEQSHPIEHLSVSLARTQVIVDLEHVNAVKSKRVYTIKHVRSRILQCSRRDAIMIAFHS